MECNKDEAIRAREIAEAKMESKDFVGAQKFLLRGQQLYPSLENISQMLRVCEIHCSAEQKLLGSEMNWYSILQVDRTADEISIKKQYRKLALVLHPDKNKFAGAEAAFKLIGEAHGVLSDQMKRSVYDMKFKTFPEASIPKQPPKPPSTNYTSTKQPGVQRTFVHFASPQFTSFKSHPQQQQTRPRVPRQLFWTVCPFCSTKYQTCNDVSGVLRCLYCKLAYSAQNMDSQGGFHGTNYNQYVNYNQHDNYNQYMYPQPKAFQVQVEPQVDPQHIFMERFYNMGFQGNCSRGPKATKSFPKAQSDSDVGKGSNTKGKPHENLDKGKEYRNLDKGKEYRNVDMGVGKKAESAPKFMADESREGSPSEKTNKKRGRTFPNTQSYPDISIGSKTDAKEVRDVGMGVGKKDEKEARFRADKYREGKLSHDTSKTSGRKLPDSQSSSSGNTASKNKDKEYGKKAEKVHKSVREKSREHKPSEKINEKGEREVPNTYKSSNSGIGSKIREKTDGNVDMEVGKRSENMCHSKEKVERRKGATDELDTKSSRRQRSSKI